MRSLQICDAVGDFDTAAVHRVDVTLGLAELLFRPWRLGHGGTNTQVVRRFGERGALFVDDRKLLARLAKAMGDVGETTLE